MEEEHHTIHKEDYIDIRMVIKEDTDRQRAYLVQLFSEELF
jgi:hypothetical protein